MRRACKQSWFAAVLMWAPLDHSQAKAADLGAFLLGLDEMQVTVHISQVQPC